MLIINVRRLVAMNEPKKNSKIRQKLTAAIALLDAESPGHPIRISTLCKMAGVNRSNIYASYSDILDDLKQLMPSSRSVAPTCQTERTVPNREVTRLRLQNKALLYLLRISVIVTAHSGAS
jgi:hypothetical protein